MEDDMIELAIVAAIALMAAATLSLAVQPKPDERAVRVPVEESEEERRSRED
jgi:hypothetical protein